MDKIAAWKAARAEVKKACEAENEALEAAGNVSLPINIRPAVAGDIVEGAIIWYRRDDQHWWMEVRTVHYPDDDFKAYTAHDGARYGLDGAYVEVTGCGT